MVTTGGGRVMVGWPVPLLNGRPVPLLGGGTGATVGGIGTKGMTVVEFPMTIVVEMKLWLGSTGGTGREVLTAGGTVRMVVSVVVVKVVERDKPELMKEEVEVVTGMVVAPETSVAVITVVDVGAETVTVSLPGRVTTEEAVPTTELTLEDAGTVTVVSVPEAMTVVPAGVTVDTVPGVTVVVGGTTTVTWVEED